jgi:hypothetical protein
MIAFFGVGDSRFSRWTGGRESGAVRLDPILSNRIVVWSAADSAYRRVRFSAVD